MKLFLDRMVSKTRRNARKSAEAMREMLGEESDNEGIHLTLQNIYVNNQPLLIPNRTTQLESEDQFEKLSQRIDTKINEGLTSSLSQFQSKLEAALESIRQTVTTSLSARSQVVTDQESDVDRGCRTTNASEMQLIANESIQGGVLGRDTHHLADNGQVTLPNWFGSQDSLGERTLSETHLAATHVTDRTGQK